MRAPLSLYKYFAPDRIAFLSNSLVRYSPLGAFNDPFEGRPRITSIMSSAELGNSINEILDEEIRKEYGKLPVAYKSQHPFPEYRRMFQAHAAALMPQGLQQVGNLSKPFLGMLHRTFDSNIGAFCLSEARDSLLMWAHYASSHTGFVVEFDSTHEYFNSGKTDQYEFGFLRPVEYREHRPRGYLLDSIEGLFTVKSSEWAYEKEWRILRLLNQAEKVIPAEPFDIHLFKIPASAIKSISIGIRANESTKSAILAATAQCKNILVYRAIPCDETFGLVFERAN